MEMNHVLVVEDDKEIREGVKIYLKSQGYEVYEAADGIEGLKVLEKEEIHLAIVDIMMPRLDGIRMTMKLREKYDFPVIMLSAKSEEVDKVKRSENGVITDPFSLSPEHTLADADALMAKFRISGVPITEGRKLVGIITNRDLKFETDFTKKIKESMTSEGLITA